MGNNVDAAHNVVKGNFVRYADVSMTERRYHHGDLRNALLAEAERTLRERGAQALSLRELARAAGVSHGAPRRHFADRQALLDALAQTGFQRLGDSLRAAVDRAGEDFEARLGAVAAAYIRFAIADPALLELMFAAKHREDEADGTLEQAALRAFAVMLELIEQGQAQGRLEPGDPERVGLVLFATIQGIATLHTGGMIEAHQIDELTGDAIASFLRGSRTADIL